MALRRAAATARWALASALADSGAVAEGLRAIERSSADLRKVVAFDPADDDARRHLHISENARRGSRGQAGVEARAWRCWRARRRSARRSGKARPGEARRTRRLCGGGASRWAASCRPGVRAGSRRPAPAMAEARRVFDLMDKAGRLHRAAIAADQLGQYPESAGRILPLVRSAELRAAAVWPIMAASAIVPSRDHVHGRIPRGTGTNTLTEGDDILRHVDPVSLSVGRVRAAAGQRAGRERHHHRRLSGRHAERRWAATNSLAGAYGANRVSGGNGDDLDIQIDNQQAALGPNYDLLADNVSGGMPRNDTIHSILGGDSVAHRADGGEGRDALAVSFENRKQRLGRALYSTHKVHVHPRALRTGGWGRIDTGDVRDVEVLSSLQGGRGNDRIVVGNDIIPINPATGNPFEAPAIYRPWR